MTLKVVIVDDEPLVRERLRTLLEAHADLVLVAECGDGGEALATIQSVEPDLLLLDIQMPELNGFEILDGLPPVRLPAVVVVTAHEEYAVRAFEMNAVDYLLKPIERSRFDAAISRARQRLAQGRETLDAELRRFLEHERLERGFAKRLVARASGRIAFVRVEDIEWIDTEGNYARLHVGGTEFLLREPLKTLERRLDPACFVRVHRSVIVNLEQIATVEPYFHGEYVVILRNGIKLTSSRTHSARLRGLLR